MEKTHYNFSEIKTENNMKRKTNSLPLSILFLFVSILFVFTYANNNKAPQNIITTDQISVKEAIEEKIDGLSDVLTNVQTQLDEGKNAFLQFSKLKSPLCNSTAFPKQQKACQEVFQRNCVPSSNIWKECNETAPGPFRMMCFGSITATYMSEILTQSTENKDCRCEALACSAHKIKNLVFPIMLAVQQSVK